VGWGLGVLDWGPVDLCSSARPPQPSLPSLPPRHWRGARPDVPRSSHGAGSRRSYHRPAAAHPARSPRSAAASRNEKRPRPQRARGRTRHAAACVIAPSRCRCDATYGTASHGNDAACRQRRPRAAARAHGGTGMQHRRRDGPRPEKRAPLTAVVLPTRSSARARCSASRSCAAVLATSAMRARTPAPACPPRRPSEAPRTAMHAAGPLPAAGPEPRAAPRAPAAGPRPQSSVRPPRRPRRAAARRQRAQKAARPRRGSPASACWAASLRSPWAATSSRTRSRRS
jgi:hypothetical protein